MLRHEFPAWTAAFSERADGDLRVSARTAAEPLEAVQARVARRRSAVGGRRRRPPGPRHRACSP